MGIRIIPYIFSGEKNQEALMCFFFFFVYKDEKCVEDIQAENRTKGELPFFFFFGLEGAWDLL